ncbi:hypothetical protein D3C71_1436480 [compost metagenome]
MLLHSTICWISARRSVAGGLTTQRTILKACLNTAGEVCSRIAARVPTMTITKAAGDHSEDRPAPLRMLPPTNESRARKSPMMLSRSMVLDIGLVNAVLSLGGFELALVEAAGLR